MREMGRTAGAEKPTRGRALTATWRLGLAGIEALRRPPLVFLAGVLVASCGDGSTTAPAEEIEGLPRALSASETLLVEAGNDFAFRFLGQLYGSAPDSNLFVSPLSASMALGMTLNGAAAETYEQMRTTLGFGAMSLDQINQGYRDLMDLLRALDPRVEMGIGNSIWYREGFPVRADFLGRARTYFDAEVAALNFAAPGAAGTINGWVSAETRGKIKEIVEDPIDAAAIMFLINAIYFKGDWTVRFPKSKTAQAPFHSLDGSTGTVPLMEVTDTFAYRETETYQAVDLPYGGKAFSMTVVLPKAGQELEELVASLDPQSWNQLVAGLSPMEGTVRLPRFRLEWGKKLNDDLKTLGMPAAFIGGQADFSGLSDEALQRGLYISQVRQKSYVDVDEEGTEAAAVTVVEIRETSAPQRFDFRADRPFLFVIRERFSQTILFAGVLVEPPLT